MTLIKPWTGVAARLDQETVDGRTLVMPADGLELCRPLPLPLVLVGTTPRVVGQVEAAWIGRKDKTLHVAGTADLDLMGSSGERLKNAGELHASLFVVPSSDGHSAEDWARKVAGWQLRTVAVHADEGSAWDPPVTVRLLREGEIISWGRSAN